MLRPLQVGAVKATDGECKRKADKVKRREGEVADREAGASHAAGLSLWLFLSLRSATCVFGL